MSFYYKFKTNFCMDEQNSQIPLKRNKICSKRAYMPASASLEAALVIPLFIFTVMSVMYLLQIAGLQLKISQVLYNESRAIAKYSYACDRKEAAGNGDGLSDFKQAVSNGIDIALVYALFLNEFDSQYVKNLHIIGGKAGFNLLTSEIREKEDKIKLTVIYSIKNPFDISGRSVFTFRQSVLSCAWMGRVPGQKYNVEDNRELMVYITANGMVFHKDKRCTYLVPSVHAVSKAEIMGLRNKNGGKYYVCETCGKDNYDKKYSALGGVYITDYGDRYHTDSNCSRIKRNILPVPFSSVGSRKPCSKCGMGLQPYIT